MRIGLGLLTVLLGGMATATAQTRGRDDVMATAYRCGGIADDRQWLDCYYGAAQPIRAMLSLPPASDAQLRLAASPPSGGDIHNAKTRGEILAEAARCYVVADDRQWLDCFYNAAQPMRSLIGLAAPAKVVATPIQPVEAFAVRKPAPTPPGGFSDWLGGSTDQRIVARLASYAFDKYGIFTVTLDNGQVWRQDSGDTAYASWKKPAGKYTAVLTRGSLGSIDLRVQGEPHVFKVTRIQ